MTLHIFGCFSTVHVTCLSNVTAVPTITFKIEKPYVLLIYFIHVFHLVFESAFPHRNIHKYSYMSPEGKSHNQIDHILVDRPVHSSVINVRLFRAADYDTDHYLVVTEVGERLVVNIRVQTSHRLHMEGFSLKKLNE
jgi:hypothetical protein